ncbi:hypothetical protein MJO28_011945 [Puccinia striiformis f. sp. tritici]|uniref:Uncharacterized protein n=1 Tax=Puccinia striiformis f. sp. tritici TaxID=168172 RepID=A0ACC0DYK9_9BASI|nr:hypothetical protein MJO28_011945 [Puccinia striiformis f. sp. tritici]
MTWASDPTIISFSSSDLTPNIRLVEVILFAPKVLKLITQIDELIECCCRNTGPLGIVCESTNGNIESGDSEEESGSSSESDQSNRGSRAPPIFLTF